jgi:hypothetical protein
VIERKEFKVSVADGNLPEWFDTLPIVIEITHYIVVSYVEESSGDLCDVCKNISSRSSIFTSLSKLFGSK